MDSDIIKWITYNGRRIPIKKSMIGKFNKKQLDNKKIEYDAKNDGKLTRTKMQKYLDKVKNKIEFLVDNDESYKEYSNIEKKLIKNRTPDYLSTIQNMRFYGLSMKNIDKMEFKIENHMYVIVATFNNGNKIAIYETTTY